MNVKIYTYTFKYYSFLEKTKMESVVNVRLLRGQSIIVNFNIDDNFEIFKAKVMAKLINIIVFDESSINNKHSSPKTLKLICFGKQLDDEYYELMKKEFCKINCIHAIYK